MSERDKTFFWAGTLFLYFSIIALTALPKFIIDFFPVIYVKAIVFKCLSALLITVATIFYFLAKNAYKKQLVAIAVSFAFLSIFLFLNQ